MWFLLLLQIRHKILRAKSGRPWSLGNVHRTTCTIVHIKPLHYLSAISDCGFHLLAIICVHWCIAILPNVMHSDGGSKLGSGDLSTPWQIIGRILFCLLVQLQLFIITILEIVGGHPVKTSLMSMRMTTDSPSMSVDESCWKWWKWKKVAKKNW